MKTFLTLCTLCATLSMQAQTKPDSTPRKTVHQLFTEDQADQPASSSTGVSPISEQEYNQRCEARKKQIRDKFAVGEMKSGDDLYDASFIFQHGTAASDYLFAHVLAMDAVIKGNDKAKWIAAATLDRYLQFIKQDQVFGTQYPLDPNVAHPPSEAKVARFAGRTLAPYNEQLIPESVRFDFCVPDLEQQKKNVAIFNTNNYPAKTILAPGCKR